MGFSSGSVVKNPPGNAGDKGWIPGLERSPGRGIDNPLQYSCLGNPMDRDAWWATVRGVAKSQTQLSDYTTITFRYIISFNTVFLPHKVSLESGNYKILL